MSCYFAFECTACSKRVLHDLQILGCHPQFTCAILCVCVDNMASSSRDWPEVPLHPAVVRVNELIEEYGHLTAMQKRNKEFRQELDIREQLLNEREKALDIREERLRDMSVSGKGQNKMPCDYCGAGTCGRHGPCVLDFIPRHRHHSCSLCHRKWKAGVAKGCEKGCDKVTMDFATMD